MVQRFFTGHYRPDAGHVDRAKFVTVAIIGITVGTTTTITTLPDSVLVVVVVVVVVVLLLVIAGVEYRMKDVFVEAFVVEKIEHRLRGIIHGRKGG